MRKMIFSSLAVIVGMALFVPVAFAQGGILFGRVTDAETGDAVAGAVVRLDGHSPLGNAEPQPPRDETTSESGEYTLLGLPSGSWNITVEAEGYQAAPGVVTVRFGRNAPVNIELEGIPHPLMAEMDPSVTDGMSRAERNAFLDGIQAELDALDEARGRGDWETALSGAQSLQQRFPTISGLYLDVGTAQAQLGRFEEAIASYEAAAAAAPQMRSQIDTQIARLRAQMGDPDAVQALISSGDAAPEDFYNQGTAAFGRGDTDQAAEWFERAAAARPDWVLPVYQLGLVSLNQGDIEGAKTHFARAVELDPASAEGQQAQAILGSLP